jgi:hypothetical protein
MAVHSALKARMFTDLFGNYIKASSTQIADTAASSIVLLCQLGVLLYTRLTHFSLWLLLPLDLGSNALCKEDSSAQRT